MRMGVVWVRAAALASGSASGSASALRGRRVAVRAVVGVVLALVTLGVDEQGVGGRMWGWPVNPAVVVAQFRAPATRYSAGHRGLDLQALPGDVVVAPESGVVAFVGVVGDRPVIALEHPGGYRSSLEPVAASAALAVGDAVAPGQPIGTVASGGHCAASCVHLGVRLDGEYVNPRLLYGGVPRAVLLPP